MNNIMISDAHLKALQKEQAARPDSASLARILSEWLDLIIEAKKRGEK